MSYVPPAQFSQNEELQRGHSMLKRNPKYIDLQKTEAALKEYTLLKYYISFVLLYAMGKLIWDFCTLTDDRDDKKIDIGIRVVQILGYGYGLQAWTNKIAWQWKIFFYYLIFSFGIIGICIYLAVDDIKLEDIEGHSRATGITNVVLNSINIPLNMFLTHVSYKFLNYLNKRDRLKKELEEEETAQDEAKQIL